MNGKKTFSQVNEFLKRRRLQPSLEQVAAPPSEMRTNSTEKVEFLISGELFIDPSNPHKYVKEGTHKRVPLPKEWDWDHLRFHARVKSTDKGEYECIV
jgi:hypothetical protein